eukprot:s636_g3.t1
MLKDDRIATHVPTLHPHSEELMIKNIRFRTYDLGGHETARRIWKDYFATVDGIIFLVDAADRTRFQEANEELNGLLNEQALANVPFVVLGNKIDIPTAASEDELRNALGLFSHMTYGRDAKKGDSSVRPVELFMVSVVKHFWEWQHGLRRSLPVALELLEVRCEGLASEWQKFLGRGANRPRGKARQSPSLGACRGDLS